MYRIDAKFIDANGSHASMTLYRAAWPVGAAAELGSALKAATDCALVSVSATMEVGDTVGTPIAANAYGNAEDAMRLYLRYTDGTQGHIDIGAPLEGGFLADNETVDLAAVHVAALVTQLNANAVSRSGAGGTVLRGKRLRRTRVREEESKEN